MSREDPPHVERLFGRPAPRPVPGCPVCARLAESRAVLASRHDRSAVTTTNVLLRQHQAQAHR